MDQSQEGDSRKQTQGHTQLEVVALNGRKDTYPLKGMNKDELLEER